MIKHYSYLLNRSFVFAIILFTATSTSKAQQRPQYTQYVVNNFILNPAVSGIENYTDIRISRRNQWLNIPGAPLTTYISAHMPLGSQSLRANINSLPRFGYNPFSRTSLNNYTAEENHHGMGVIGVFDQVGPFL